MEDVFPNIHAFRGDPLGMARGLMIAATSSGTGKTSVTLALCRAFARAGLKVAPFKVGPDFLDPTYLEIAADSECHNLDIWMTGEDYMKRLFADKAADADIALVEGVMGLFDGVSAETLEGSSADVARSLGLPVILLVNAKGMSRSIAPMVKGFADFHPDVKIAGVIANHIGSEKHLEWLGDSLAAAGLPPLIGAIPKEAFEELPSRHLGLRTADSRLLDSYMLDSMADVIESNSDGDMIMEIAGMDILPTEEAATPPAEPVARLAVAMDRAFHFYYRDNLSALEREGCELCFFSPLKDEALPEDIDGLYIGGGYPEEYAKELATNVSMKDSIRGFAEGHPVYGECGGLVYLSEGVDTLDGNRHDFVGLLPARAKMNSRYKSLGYVEAEFLEDTVLGKAGGPVRGHRFHYSELTEDPAGKDGWRSVYDLKGKRNAKSLREGYMKGGTLLSYAHLHFASAPGAAKCFVDSLANAMAGNKS